MLDYQSRNLESTIAGHKLAIKWCPGTEKEGPGPAKTTCVGTWACQEGFSRPTLREWPLLPCEPRRKPQPPSGPAPSAARG